MRVLKIAFTWAIWLLRDWGHARDYAEMQWRMLQQSGGLKISSSLQAGRNRCDGLSSLRRSSWVGAQLNGAVVAGSWFTYRRGGRANRPRYCPAEVETLLVIPAKPTTSWAGRSCALEQLVAEMVAADREEARKSNIAFGASTWWVRWKIHPLTFCSRSCSRNRLMTMLITPDDRIFVAGDRGMVGSAICRALQRAGYSNLITATRAELDLEDELAVQRWFNKHQPTVVILAAAKVGGILANNTYPADFLLANLKIQINVIETARTGVRRLCFWAVVAFTRSLLSSQFGGSLAKWFVGTYQWMLCDCRLTGLKLCDALRRQ